MSYEVGDKFIIEIDRIYSSEKHKKSRYGIKGFSNLVFDRETLDRVLKHGCFSRAEEAIQGAYLQGFAEGNDDGWNHAYQKGREDAWDLVRRIENDPNYGGLTNEELIMIFGENWMKDDLYRNLTVQEAQELVNAYDKACAQWKEKKREFEDLKVDFELSEFCDKQAECFFCPMKNLFPKCGRGWHVSCSKGKENEAAHKILEAAEALKEDEKK